LTFVFYMLALAQLWNLLAGYAGLVSVDQQAFVGLGGYLLFALTIIAGMDPLPAIALAGLITAGCAVPTALLVFRLRGAYFAIGMLGIVVMLFSPRGIWGYFADRYNLVLFPVQRRLSESDAPVADAKNLDAKDIAAVALNQGTHSS
jgi:ABC-type branched-subunit amino acid transport system permease subunit